MRLLLWLLYGFVLLLISAPGLLAALLAIALRRAVRR